MRTSGRVDGCAFVRECASRVSVRVCACVPSPEILSYVIVVRVNCTSVRVCVGSDEQLGLSVSWAVLLASFRRHVHRPVGRSTSRLTALGIIIIRLAADLTPTDQCVNTVLLCLTSRHVCHRPPSTTTHRISM